MARRTTSFMEFVSASRFQRLHLLVACMGRTWWSFNGIPSLPNVRTSGGRKMVIPLRRSEENQARTARVPGSAPLVTCPSQEKEK
jgi:hypothetical protein